VFDTDVGNDVDDALALGVIHALADRGECRLLAVTISKDNRYTGPFVDLVNHFYGRGEIPIGVVKGGFTPEDGKFNRQVASAEDNGQRRYPRSVEPDDDLSEATTLLRRVLAQADDASVVFVVVGFSTNLARLLDSPADDLSPHSGVELVRRKCRLLSLMAGMFTGQDRHKEYNVFIDVDSARAVYERWPTPLVASGYEIGLAITYPAVSIERDYAYVAHHPLREAYEYYGEMPYDRPTWDLTSVLYAVRPERGYFNLSEPGTIHVDPQSVTQFTPSAAGQHRYLIVDPLQIERVREALVQLASQPPRKLATPPRR
jgi:inosine-uridine nucleoside N-ribohydrolase